MYPTLQLVLNTCAEWIVSSSMNLMQHGHKIPPLGIPIRRDFLLLFLTVIWGGKDVRLHRPFTRLNGQPSFC